MTLVPESLRAVLPPRPTELELSPFVYAHYHVPDHPWHYYVTNGTPRHSGYELFGLLLPSEEEHDWRWTTMRTSDLESILGVRRDEDFIPGPFPESVPYPFLDG